MLMVSASYAHAVETTDNENISNIVDEYSIGELIDNYAVARNEFLKGDENTNLSEWAVDGIVEDEKVHRDHLINETIKIVESSMKITSISDDEICLTLNVTETVSLEGDPIAYSVDHIIKVFGFDSGDGIVASDNYKDNYSTFISASYVDETETDITNRATASSSCIVTIAKNEVGYHEKASNSSLNSFTDNAGSANYTKYGKWYGTNGVAWCAIFVSWCANQAGVSTSIIPKTNDCDTSMSKFKTRSRFYSASGSYTPQVGDLFFVGTTSNGVTDATHTGIVVSVTSSNITVVDGNYGNKVSKHTYSRTDTSLLGYGNPKYTTSSHSYSYSYNDDNHWKECTVCGKTQSKSSHVYEYTSNSSYHWKKCTTCEKALTKSTHKWVLNASGTLYTCSVCKRTTTLAPSTTSL